MKISSLTINSKTENGSRLITEYYAFTIRVDQVNFLREKFGVSAYSRDRLVAELVRYLFKKPLFWNDIARVIYLCIYHP